MSKTAYIAGKITGLPKNQVKTKFNLIAKQLIGLGYKVMKPSAVSNNEDHETVRDDIQNMLKCDELHLLPDWQESRGAQLERDIALRVGMNLVYH